MFELADHPFEARSSGRFPASCVVCGKVPEAHPVTHIPRDMQGERVITALAAQAGGVREAAARSLDDFADARALPGGVRIDLDAVREISEELADARNYLVWGVQRTMPGVEQLDHDALEQYEPLMRCLAAVQEAWAALHRC